MTSNQFVRAMWSAFGLLIVASAAAVAQTPVEVEVDAVAGSPYGIGRVTLTAQAGAALQAGYVEGFALTEKNKRVHYPSFSNEQVRSVFRNLLNRPQKLTAYFLFTGAEPLELELLNSGAPTVVAPRGDPQLYTIYMQDWWQQFSGQRKVSSLLFREEDNSPPQVKNYLRALLSKRLGLPLPSERKGLFDEPELDESLGITLGSEAIRLEMQRNSLLRPAGPPEVANQPLPPTLVVPKAPAPPPPANVTIEPIAEHVPAECFYLRFGSYANFQWLKNFLQQAGGDVLNLVTYRGLDRGLSARIEKQLVIKTSVLSNLLGDVVLSDVALIGDDAFLREGAAIGILFEARNSALFASQTNGQRSALLVADKDVLEDSVDIAGHEVSFLTKPDNSVRSYYAQDGDYHLVTTSRAMVERFYAAGKGDRSLAKSPEFQVTRGQMPITRKDTIFLFVSTDCLSQLLTPQYRVEMARRLQASSDIELAYLAKLTARCEGKPADTLEQLVAGGYLPAGFGTRPDGSRIELDGPRAIDTLRGARGSFIPVPDVEITGLTPTEVQDYARFAAMTQQKVQHLDSMVVGVQRQTEKNNPNERITIDARVTPFSNSHMSFLAQWFSGPPDSKRLAPVSGDLIAVESVLAGQHLFGGLRDCNPERWLGQGTAAGAAGTVLSLLGNVLGDPENNDLMGYIGATGGGSPLSFLGPQQYSPPDAQGISRTRLFYRRTAGDYVVLSFHRDVLTSVGPLLKIEDAVRPASGRIRVGDLRDTQLAGTFDSLSAKRAESASLGNVQLMNSLAQQLLVPAAECREAAETILDAKLVCPLGGTYELVKPSPRAPVHWNTTVRENPADAKPKIPGPYRNPVLNWFRGLEGDGIVEGQNVIAHIEMNMQAIGTNKEQPIKQLEQLPLVPPAAAPAAKAAGK